MFEFSKNPMGERFSEVFQYSLCYLLYFFYLPPPPKKKKEEEDKYHWLTMRFSLLVKINGWARAYNHLQMTKLIVQDYFMDIKWFWRRQMQPVYALETLNFPKTHLVLKLNYLNAENNTMQMDICIQFVPVLKHMKYKKIAGLQHKTVHRNCLPDSRI